MYLFLRSLRTRMGNPAAALGWAAEITQKVNSVTSLGVTSFLEILSPRVGQFYWASVAEDLQAFEDAFAKLMSDSGFVSLAEKGQDMAGANQLEDQLWEFIQSEQREGLEDYGVVIQASVVPGSQMAAVEVALEVAALAKRLTGVPVDVAVSGTGAPGRLQWTSFHPSLASVEEARRALMASAEYGKMVDSKMAPLCRRAEQFLIRKVA